MCYDYEVIAVKGPRARWRCFMSHSFCCLLGFQQMFTAAVDGILPGIYEKKSVILVFFCTYLCSK